MGILNLLNPIKGLFSAVTGLVDEVVTTDEERLAAKAKLAVIEQAFTADILKYEAKIAEEQASIVRAEVTSQSVLARNWRPVIMLMFGYIIFHNYVLVPVFGIPATEIPVDMWQLLKIGMGGYVLGRSAEKIVPGVIGALRKKQDA